MPFNLTQRLATQADIPSIYTLVQSAYRGDSSRRGWTTEADLLDDQRVEPETLLKKLNAPDGRIILWHDDSGALTACCETVKRAPKDGETTPVATVGLFAVDPSRQAGGIGKKVLAAVEALAVKNWKVRTLEMHVLAPRTELIAFYERRGFVKTGERKPFTPDQPSGKIVELEFLVLQKALV